MSDGIRKNTWLSLAVARSSNTCARETGKSTKKGGVKIAWDSTKSPGDLITASDENDRTTAIKARSKVTSGAGAPSSTPESVGDIYVDTTNNYFYIARGTSSSDDWRQVLSQ